MNDSSDSDKNDNLFGKDARRKKNHNSLTNLLQSNLLINTLSGILFVFMEWLFFITKPSFLSASQAIEKTGVLVVTSLLVVAFLLLFSIPALLICAIFPKQIKFFARLLAIVPAVVLASLALLLLDNFTYTVFKFGIVDSIGPIRGVYLIVWILLFILANLRLAQYVIQHFGKKSGYKYACLLAMLVTIVSIILFLIFIQVPSDVRGELDSLNTTKGLPNILLFTADGVNAENMSLYGYERETTPFLDSIKESLIISQNHFTNSANTSGSIVSIMTGKYPTKTRLLYPPDVLKGKNSIEHLPGILNNMGYYTAQFAVDHYIDSSTQNLQDSFDESNGNRKQASFTMRFISNRFSSNSKLFLNEVEVRLISRIKHIFFIESMENTFLQITETQRNFNDTEKVIEALKVVENKSEPVFVHIHWMGTHGSKFFPDSTKYSSDIDRENQPLWDEDLYDDAIIDVDTALRLLVWELSRIKELDNSIIIFTSDHGQRFTVNNKLPMVIYYPVVDGQVLPLNNTQNIDIAPTILDLINVEQPNWMSDGKSILTNSQSRNHIISTGTLRSENTGSGNILDEEYLDPPFYQFDFMTVIDCDRYYRINLEELSWSSGVVSTYVGTCSEKDYSSKAEVRSTVLNRLTEDGFEFDPSMIPEIP